MSKSIVSHNLIDFYTDFLDFKNAAPYIEIDCYFFIHKPWPFIIFNNSNLIPKTSLINQPDETVYISESNLINSDIKASLKNSGYIPVTRWWGMEWNQKSVNPIHQNNIEIEKVDSNKKLNTWINIIIQSPLVTVKTNDDINQLPFIHTLNNPHFQYYTMYFDKVAVGTFLLYHKNGIMGIYMVSVIQEYRGKGIMFDCLSRILEQIKSEKVILHSTLMAKSVYKKMGFNELLTYDIYIKK